MNLHKHALDQLNLQVGDIIKIKYKVPSNHGGWMGSWIREMDELIGKELKVFHVSEHMLDINYNGGIYSIPAHCVEIVRRANSQPSPQSIHQVALEALDLQPGDTVKVLFKVPSFDGGWKSSWTSEMDKMIGEVFTVADVGGNSGIGSREDGYYYPAHCLEVIKRAPKHTEIKLNKDYVANITADVVKVGCQTIDADTVLEVAEAIKKLRG
jgi:hypothetical protein